VKFRSLVIIPALAVALAIPAARAQQLTEQEAHQVAQGLADQFYKLYKAKDAAAVAAHYTSDTVRINGNGDLLLGPAAVQKFYGEKVLPNFDEDPPKIIRVKVINNDTIVVFGSWSGTHHGDNARLSGRWVTTDVRVGDGWKITAMLVSDIPQK
jgi:ketosteroid isomerase-like protein